MRIGITAKFFFVILAVSFFAVLAMSIGSRVSFTRGFLGYLNDQGMVRVEAIVPTLVEAYETHGSWDFLRGNQRVWVETVGLYSVSHGGDFSSSRIQPEAIPAAFGLRISLFDAQGQLVAGNVETRPSSPRRSIVVEGQEVGWLALQPFQEVSGAGGTANLRFEKRQLYTTWFIALGTVFLAGMVAMWMARRFLSGLKQVTHSVQHLADGDYSVRAPALSYDEIGALAENCNRLAQTLERTEQMRREFMADVSHELRTPLAVLRAEFEALEDGMQLPTVELVRSLQAEVGTLSKLVDDIYSLSVADAGAQAFRMERIDACECLHVVLGAFEDRLGERRIQLDKAFDIDRFFLMGDPGRLWQLFANITENAIRYAESGGLLRVRCSNENRTVLITFDDAGPGVEDEVLPHIFDRFYRVERSRSRTSGGTGLGLAICKSIVQAHGGTIFARPSALGGLCVLIKLPTTA